MKRSCTIIPMILLGGCAVNPSVRYQAATDAVAVQRARLDLIDSYVLQKNELRIEFKNTAAADKPPVYDLSVTNNKLEDPTQKLMLLRGDQLWSRTMINLAKVENTDLISTAGVEVEDRRIEFIQTAGTILKAVVPFIPGVAGANPVPGCETFPATVCTIVPTDVITTMTQNKGSIGQTGSLTLSWGAISSTAEASDTVLPNLARQRRNGLYYAACREITVQFARPAGNTATVYQWRGKIADPRYVEFVAFPRKGSVRMHAQCGVSTSSEKDPTKTSDAVISAAITQAIAVKEALDKASADDKK